MAKITITQVSVENLGPFRERQVLNLSTSKQRPVILIKALNGSGKTTLLTCLQIGLYGYKAINPLRRSEYEQLMVSLQRKDATSAAIVEVTLEVEVGADKRALTIRREWQFRNNQLHEHMAVLRGGVEDIEFTGSWDEFINGILPVELVQLFLFDGEKIEALANPERLPDLLRRATEVFLGLGGIDALGNDLKAVERRSSLNKKDASDGFLQAQSEVEEFHTKQVAMDDRIAVLAQQLAEAQNQLDRVLQRLDAYKVKAQRQGLDAYQQAAQLRSNAQSADLKHKGARTQLADALSDPLLPLIWLGPLWHQYRAQWDVDQNAHHSKLLMDEFAKRDRRLLQVIAKAAPNEEKVVAKLMRQDLSDFKTKTGQSNAVLMPGTDPADIEIRLEHAKAKLHDCVKNVDLSSRQLERSQLSVGAIPAEEQLASVLDGLQAHAQEVSLAEQVLARLSHELTDARSQREHLRIRAESAQERLRSELKDNALELKALDAAARAKKALATFRERILASKAHWLSAMITKEFKGLLRKRNLVSKVLVDPTTYAVSIEDSKGHLLPMERLSAGERQILAIAVLSALINERKGRFPVVVDTPLARLDRKHRESLVKSFFAKVSHQVLVLSTDEEVAGSVYEALLPHMSREFELSFDDVTRATKVQLLQPTMLQEEEAHA
jgi:DNA sulfur modification protein DndD